MSILTLYKEELRAVVRGRFAWLGAAVVLLSIGGLAAIATQDTWLDGYGIIAYFLAPMSFIPLAAGSIASPRANRFVESLFTAPVERGDWLTAKILVLLTLALGYYLALLPMMLVYVAHVGMPLLLARLVAWTPGILLVSVAVGTVNVGPVQSRLVGDRFTKTSYVPGTAPNSWYSSCENTCGPFAWMSTTVPPPDAPPTAVSGTRWVWNTWSAEAAPAMTAASAAPRSPIVSRRIDLSPFFPRS